MKRKYIYISISVLLIIIIIGVIFIQKKKAANLKDEPEIILSANTIDKDEVLLRANLSKAVINESRSRYWICIVKEGSPDEEKGSWFFIPNNKINIIVPLPKDKTPGKYEVRLHRGFPVKKYDVVDRKSIEIK
jgi:hypothetical protein